MTRPLRESGVSWLGKTPEDWPVVPARALFGERKEKSDLADVHLTPSQKYGVLPQAEYMEITGNKVVLNLSGADNMRHVESGDYVSHLRSFQGGVEFASMPGKVSAAYTVLMPKVPLEPRFFKYLFKSDLYIQALQTTTDQLRDGQSIRFGQFALIPLPYPDLDEQRAVADYLDQETTQIDVFIAKNQELVALLRERRAAVVARATTRGIRDDACLVESGLQWVGEVPSHWSVQPTRTVLRIAKSIVGPSWSETPLLSLTKRGVIVRDIESGEGKFPTSFEGYQLVNAGELVFCLFDVDETPRTVGLVTQYGMLTGAYTRFLVNLRFADPRYLELYYIAIDDEKRFRPLYTGLRNVIKKERFLSAGLVLPPLEEQREIVDAVHERHARIDHAISVAERGVQLARERRAALISAAVTGKIDVGMAA